MGPRLPVTSRLTAKLSISASPVIEPLIRVRYTPDFPSRTPGLYSASMVMAFNLPSKSSKPAPTDNPPGSVTIPKPLILVLPKLSTSNEMASLSTPRVPMRKPPTENEAPRTCTAPVLVLICRFNDPSAIAPLMTVNPSSPLKFRRPDGRS